ncbi:DUF3291 domain-containing protein [Frankia tisae]|uniref:DUF3291 domain-containing protein n=1 Tax=Frankia tisae TaxID=2950104 RepID=UPI0021BF5490|nr:DUF3291 domain-containing protein [Frankia tisae]
MPTIPWTIPPDRKPGAAHTSGTNPADGAIEVMASHFVLTSTRHTVAMLRSAMAVRRAVLAAPGALGVSLVARPLRREYWTLSAWTDRAALDAFVGDPRHREAMRRLGPAMARSRFVFWRPRASAGAPTWAQAHEHLAAPTD